ncbi:MAG: MFS transporter [Boseongicola sp. SB0665_bin_10]|nr:MFS transporter [Boseongicola sp. SB0665_bin_10]
MLEIVRDNSMQTILPSIVQASSLEKANGRNWAAKLLCNSLVGPMLGGAMLLWAPCMPFAVAGLLYAFGAAAFLRVRGAFTLRKRQSTWWQDIREAAGFLLSHDFLLKLAAVAGAWNLFFLMALTALILHVQENLGGSSFDYSSVLAVGALGGAVGGWFGNRIVATLGPGRTAQYALLFSTPSFLCMAVAPDTWSLALVYFLFNFSGTV